MSIGIYIGGTTGATDGTLEVPGDGAGIALGVIGSVATFHLRCPSGYESSESLTVNAPAECEVSVGGVTYGATAVYASGSIEDVNVVCYVKRTSGTAASTTGLVTTPRLAVATTAAYAPVLGGTLSATAGDGQVVLNWDDATDNVAVTGYDVEYGTTLSYGSSVSPDPTLSTATVTGLPNGTLQYFRVRAYDAEGHTSAWITASATPLLSQMLDSFDAGSAGANVLGSLWSALSVNTPAQNPTAVYNHTNPRSGSAMECLLTANASAGNYSGIAETQTAGGTGTSIEYRLWLRIPSGMATEQVVALLARNTSVAGMAFFIDFTSTTGKVRYLSSGSGFVASGHTFATDAWRQYRLVLNYTAHTLSFYVRTNLGDAWTTILSSVGFYTASVNAGQGLFVAGLAGVAFTLDDVKYSATGITDETP